MSRTLWEKEVPSVTGHGSIVIDVDDAEGPYPATLSVIVEPALLISDDARAWALALLAAAEVADQASEASAQQQTEMIVDA